jgi:hypothetical protein
MRPWFLVQCTASASQDSANWEDLLQGTMICKLENKSCSTDCVGPVIIRAPYGLKAGVFELIYHADCGEP